MKIKNLAKIVLMITFFIIIEAKVYASTGIINEESVKLRKAPDSKTVLDLVNKGDEVEILEQEDGWYKVKAITGLGKVTGYISEEKIDLEEKTTSSESQEEIETSKEVEENTQTTEKIENGETDSEETMSTEFATEPLETTSTIAENANYILEQEINIKVLPLINSMEKAKITGNITIIEIINDWVRVENEVESGWVRKNILKNATTKQQTQETPPQQEEQIEEQPEEVKQEETTQEQPQNNEQPELKKVGYVSTDGLRVRKGPSTDSEEIDSLSKNDEVQIIGQEGKWYKIDLGGKIGYVSAKYISDTKVPETTSRSGSTLRNENLENNTQETRENTQEEKSVQENLNTNTTGVAVVEYAKKYLGYRYVSGGTSPSTGFDCSGFTQYVYKHFGVSLNRSSSAQINNGVAVEKSNLQPGDLVLFNNDANTKIGHVGIYIGDGNFIHASNPSDGVKITTLTTGYYQKRYVGARRIF